MAQNIDDFFKRKIENIQDILPENPTFDEAALWGNIQQDLHKPKRSLWYWIVPVAACLVAVLSWWILPERSGVSHTPIAITHEKKAEKPMIIKEKSKNNNSENHKKAPVLKKKKSIILKKLDFPITSIASKNVEFLSKNVNKLPDSLNFQSNIAFEKKPKVNFKTVHINEISKQGDVPFQQPRFKVQFAGKLFEKTEINHKETIQIPSIRIQ